MSAKDRSMVKPGLRMQELVQATGQPKSTILHYLSRDLLPEPVKTSPNMAYYDPLCVERIKLIRHLQRHHRMTLAEIKQMLDTEGDPARLSLRLALNDMVFGPVSAAELLDESFLRKKTGLSQKQLNQLVQARLLLPLANDRFDEADVAMGKIYAEALAWGIGVEDLTYYVDLGEKIVDCEVDLRRRITGDLDYETDAAMTLQMVQNARMTRAYIIDRLFQSRVAGMKDIKDDPEGEHR